MRYACLVIILLAATSAPGQDGAEVYKAYCANCHNSGAMRVPPESALRAVSLKRVLAALETGVMKTVGDTLTPEERYAVARYLSAGAPKSAPLPPSPFCAGGAAPFRYSSSGALWTGWSTTTGKQLWKVAIARHSAAIITAAPLLHKGVLYFGVSSFEEALAPLPGYPCCPAQN